MHRMAFGLVALICICPSKAAGQEAAFRIDTATAAVHKAPSTGSPVIGHVNRGAMLEVTRELGSWVKVNWPDAADGIGYVHVSTGTATGSPAPGPAEAIAASLGAASAASPATETGTDAAASQAHAASLHHGYVVPPTHVVGLGGTLGGSEWGAGFSARTWFHDRIGVQIEALRSSHTDPALADRHTATIFSPSALVSLPEVMTDYFWLRPYAGAGPRFVRRTITVTTQPAGLASSRSGVGFQAFTGSELTFAGMPRFTVSADVRYGRMGEGVAGEPDGFGVAVSGHWYIK